MIHRIRCAICQNRTSSKHQIREQLIELTLNGPLESSNVEFVKLLNSPKHEILRTSLSRPLKSHQPLQVRIPCGTVIIKEKEKRRKGEKQQITAGAYHRLLITAKKWLIETLL